MCDFPLCTYPAGHDGYCIHHSKHFGVKEVKVKKGIAKMSAKRKMDVVEYRKIVKRKLKESNLCEIKEKGCGKIATGLHHQKKRTPATYLDERFLIRACNNCNTWVELHPLEAIKKGYSLSKFK
jgi:hypothetical protein